MRLQAAWHAISAEEALEELETSPRGLDESAVARRAAELGPNVLTRARRERVSDVALRQFKNPLALVLLGSGVLAFVLGSATDGAVVVGVVILNAMIGAIQELRAMRAISALDALVPEQALTFRGGDLVSVPAPELVPGDVVLLQTGARVPADMRLVFASNAQANEMALTGESTPVSKSVDPVAERTPLAERSCMLFAGTVLAGGTATGVVVAIGSMTELGRISMMLQAANPPETPLLLELKRFGVRLTKVICVVAAVIFVVAAFRGFPLFEAVRSGVSLACGSIPVGLPAAVTITLAVAVRRMAVRNAIVRALPSIETLGAANTICSDKTGTLTVGEMTVREIWANGELYQVTGTGYVPEGELRHHDQPLATRPQPVEALVLSGAICNDAVVRPRGGTWTGIGNMTEIALAVLAMKLGLDLDDVRARWRRLDTIPFESKTRFMATLHETPTGKHLAVVKGAPEVILGLCGAVDRTAIMTVVDLLAASGMRVLAVATLEVSRETTQLDRSGLTGARLLGLFGLQDPPRPEAIEAIAACHGAGIEIKMVTGDHPATAKAIGAEMGIVGTDDGVLTGADLDQLDDSQLWEVVEEVELFARVEPVHKLRLVEALQRRGKTVAMTGDGVNDAPALRQADVGIAMGRRGTAAARDAADIILVDDNFASIAAAVEEGRRCFENLMKLLIFLVPTNIGQGLIIFLGVLFFPIVDGIPLMPIIPLQILWVNFVTGVTLAIPLAWERADADLMRRAPRVRDQKVLGGHLTTRCILVGLLMAAGGIGLFLWQYDDIRPFDEPDFALRKAQTMAVTTVVLFQVLYLFQCRSLRTSVLRVSAFSNPLIYVGMFVTIAMQIAFVHSSTMNLLFHGAPLEPREWLLSAFVATAVLPLVSLHKRSAAKAQRAQLATWPEEAG